MPETEPIYMVAIGMHVEPISLERKVQVAAHGCSIEEAIDLLKKGVAALEKQAPTGRKKG